ncbi:MAG: class I SAM-dependent methyltransferase [Deltaproteobacteria bacterium]|nr:class I SAM-dependent methyltransferase [Deltaproteobacteria bacterium]
MRRVPEPELMDAKEQAAAYAVADFAEPHQLFVSTYQRLFPDPPEGPAVDLGCGPGDVLARFSAAYPRLAIDGIDAGPNMLRAAAERLADHATVRLFRVHLPASPPAAARYGLLISNSLLHHLPDPQVLWQTIKAWSAERAQVLVMDLRRPDSAQIARELVERHSGAEPELLKQDFYNSLLAAYRVEEVAGQLARAGLALEVEPLGDRHLIVWGKLGDRSR